MLSTEPKPSSSRGCEFKDVNTQQMDQCALLFCVFEQCVYILAYTFDWAGCHHGLFLLFMWHIGLFEGRVPNRHDIPSPLRLLIII